MTTNQSPAQRPTTDSPEVTNSPEGQLPAPIELDVVEVVPSSPFTQDQATVIAGALGRNWGVLLGFGIVFAGLGVAVMVWPHATIGVVALLMGVALLITGVFQAISGFTRSDYPTPLRVLAVISGVISVVLGGLALTGITQAVTILALMIGFGWIVRGVGDLVAGLAAKGQRGRGLVIATGITGLIAGVAVLAWPSITLVALAVVSGIWLIILGIVQMVLAFRVRNVRTAQDLQEVFTP